MKLHLSRLTAYFGVGGVAIGAAVMDYWIADGFWWSGFAAGIMASLGTALWLDGVEYLRAIGR